MRTLIYSKSWVSPGVNRAIRTKAGQRFLRAWLLFALVFVLLLSSCGSKEKPLNVYLITMDTTRADHLGCYGHEGIETPHIDRLAKLGTRYEQAYSVVPVTLPSHLSMMTGTYPAYHGVRENAGFYVPEEMETLAEVLKKEGYATGAVIGAFPLDSQTGMDQGFDTYDDNYPSRADDFRHPLLKIFFDERPAAEVALSATSWLRKQKEAPFFLWTHFFDPHHPLTPPSPFRERYHDAPYDAEIASVDAAIGQILDQIEALGESQNTLVILTADHGEGHGEHGEETHALLLFSSTLHVPLIVKDPRDPTPRVVKTPVATLDIFSTVLNKLGIAIPKANQGVPLPKTDAEADPERAILSESLFGRVIYGWSPLKRVTKGNEVFIHGPSNRLYNRELDRKELNDLSTQKPEMLAQSLQRLRQLEAQWEKGGYRGNRSKTTPETMERLAALGYVGAGMGTETEFSDRMDPDRLDPLVSMHIFDLHNEGRSLLEAGHLDMAIPLFERAQEEDPQNPAVIMSLVQAHINHKDWSKALPYLELLSRVAPEKVTTYVLLANYQVSLNDYDQAVALLLKAVDMEPADLSTRLLLAYTLEDASRLEHAEKAYREILELDAKHVLAANGLATLVYRSGDITQAERLLKTALSQEPYYAPAYLNMGVIRYDQGHFSEASRLAKRALALKPGYPQAAQLLALCNSASAK